MAWLGTLFNVAQVGVGLLNGVLNGGRAQPAMKWYIEYDTGMKFQPIVKYIVAHPDPSKVGTKGPFTALDDSEVSFVYGKDVDGNDKITAWNNDASNDYYISFTQTGGDGALPQPVQGVIPHAFQPGNPNNLDVTNSFTNAVDGNVLVSQVEQTTLSITTGESIPTSTLLANFGVNSVLANSTYTLYNSRAGVVTFSWIVATDGSTITGCTVKNGLTYPISVTSTLVWDSPTQSFPANFIAAAAVGTTPTPTSYSFMSTDRPIQSASIAISSAATSAAFVKGILAERIDALRVAGLLHYPK